MKHILNTKMMAVAALLFAAVTLSAKEMVVEIKNFDSKRGTFTLNTYGEKPAGSSVDFYNDFGATSGNTYNQIPGQKEATLDLWGWEGCTIDSITFGMRSNKNEGRVQAKVDIYKGTKATSVYDSGIKEFNNEGWYGNWVRFSNNVTVDITKEMTTKREIVEDEYVTITITGGDKAGMSVYLDRLTIYYTPAAGVETEKPLPYKFTKLGKTDVLADGDICILINGSNNGACEVDTSETNPYLGVTAVGNLSEVYVPENNSLGYAELLFFEMKKKDDAWQMIDQFGDTLGCKGTTHMTKNSGVTTWNISFGKYVGAPHTIASTNEKYGSIQYNYEAQPQRFSNYASSQGAVYLCRRGEQQKEVAATAFAITDVREMTTCTDTVIVRHQFTPTTTTDQRVIWKSLNPEVATVRDGIVRPVAKGTAKIVAISRANAALSDTCVITVEECTVESVMIMDEKGKERVVSLGIYECADELTTLTAAINPSNAPINGVVWESSNDSVVTVVDGVLTPVAAGTADVIVRTLDGDKTDTCYVTILPCEIEDIEYKYPETDKEFTLKDCGGLVDGKGERFQIYVTVMPEFLTVSEDDFICKSSDESVATVYFSVGEITQSICATVHAIAPGTATITIASAKDESIKVESKVTVVSCETALGEVELNAIYAENGTIYADGDMRIFTVTGIDVTELNGQLSGIYVVRLGGNSYKISVK